MAYYMGYELLWEKYPSMEFLDGDPFALEFVDPSPGSGFNVITAGKQRAPVGRAIKADNVPTTLRWKSGKTMPDFEGPPGFLCVSLRLKEIIEQFEPGVHQFFPLKVIDKAGEPLAERWLWVMCNLIDSVDREHTTLVLDRGLWGAEGVKAPRLVFSSRLIGTRQFWRDVHLLPQRLLCSDKAGEALAAAKLTALSLTHKETV